MSPKLVHKVKINQCVRDLYPSPGFCAQQLKYLCTLKVHTHKKTRATIPNFWVTYNIPIKFCVWVISDNLRV